MFSCRSTRYTYISIFLLGFAFNCFWPIVSQSNGMHIVLHSPQEAVKTRNGGRACETHDVQAYWTTTWVTMHHNPTRAYNDTLHLCTQYTLLLFAGSQFSISITPNTHYLSLSQEYHHPCTTTCDHHSCTMAADSTATTVLDLCLLALVIIVSPTIGQCAANICIQMIGRMCRGIL